jgi:hypothetical protein
MKRRTDDFILDQKSWGRQEFGHSGEDLHVAIIGEQYYQRILMLLLRKRKK